MKQTLEREVKPRFDGHLRYYHRVGSQTPRTWDEWVDGKAAHSISINWPKRIGILVAVLALCGIITGLIVELG
jgi:hypothetical protein